MAQVLYRLAWQKEGKDKRQTCWTTSQRFMQDIMSAMKTQRPAYDYWLEADIPCYPNVDTPLETGEKWVIDLFDRGLKKLVHYRFTRQGDAWRFYWKVVQDRQLALTDGNQQQH